MKGLSWLITVPVTVVVVVFAIANRGLIAVSFWPLPWIVPLPVYLVILGSLFLGFLLGAIVAWFSAGRRRQRARQTAEHARALARQLADLQQRHGAPSPASTSSTAVAPIGRARRVPVE